MHRRSRWDFPSSSMKDTESWYSSDSPWTVSVPDASIDTSPFSIVRKRPALS